MVRDCLRDLVAKRAAVASNAAKGKARDDARGKRIIPDYHLVHKPVEDEKIVQQAQRYEYCGRDSCVDGNIVAGTHLMCVFVSAARQQT